MEDDITNQITGYLNKLFTKDQELGIIRRDYSSMQLAYSFSGIFSVQFIHVCLLNQADFKLDMDMQIDCFLNGALAKDVWVFSHYDVGYRRHLLGIRFIFLDINIYSSASCRQEKRPQCFRSARASLFMSINSRPTIPH